MQISKEFNPSISHPTYFIRKYLLSYFTKLSPYMKGVMLDFGCGSKPYKSLFSVNEYVGLDYENPGHPHINEQIDVFYNGKDTMEERELLLSEAYTRKTEKPNLELRVKVQNINLGNSEEIYKKSRTMHDYMIFVDKTRRYSENQPLEAAIELAVEECIREDVLRDFLLK